MDDPFSNMNLSPICDDDGMKEFLFSFSNLFIFLSTKCSVFKKASYVDNTSADISLIASAG